MRYTFKVFTSFFLTGLAYSQTVNPNQIRPSNTGGQVLQTPAANTPPVWASPVQVNGSNIVPATPANFVNSSTVTFSATGDQISAAAAAGQFQTEIVPPVAGQFVIIPPTIAVPSVGGCGLGTATVSPSGSGYFTMTGVCGGSNGYSGTYSGYVLPSYVNPANVTAVYGALITANVSNDQFNGHSLDSCTSAAGTSYFFGGGQVNGFVFPMQQFNVLMSGTTGANVASITCFSSVGANTNFPFPANYIQNMAALDLVVYYTGTPPPANTNIQVVPPLFYNTANQTLGSDPNFAYPGRFLSPIKIASLPNTAVGTNQVWLVSDATGPFDCTGGGGTLLHECWSNGSNWFNFSNSVQSINGTTGPYTFSFSAGAGNCTGTTCTFTGSGSGGGSVTNFIASAGSWPSWLVPSVATGTTTPTLSVAASAIPNASLATQTANTVLGALTATTPSGLAMPSCSTASSALTWTTSTGFGCNSISGGGAVTSVANSDGTLTISPTTGFVVSSLNLAHVNTWTGAQTYTQPVTVQGSSEIATGTASNTDLAGILIASGGTASYTFTGTYTSSPVCVVQDDTLISNLVSKGVNTTTLTVTTTGLTDHVSYLCIGRN